MTLAALALLHPEGTPPPPPERFTALGAFLALGLESTSSSASLFRFFRGVCSGTHSRFRLFDGCSADFSAALRKKEPPYLKSISSQDFGLARCRRQRTPWGEKRKVGEGNWAIKKQTQHTAEH